MWWNRIKKTNLETTEEETASSDQATEEIAAPSTAISQQVAASVMEAEEMSMMKSGIDEEWEPKNIKVAEQSTIVSVAKRIVKSIVTWEWTKRLLHWIIISAGTMSECVFLVATLWVSVNANVHDFVLFFISEKTTTFLTQLATTAYVALPECIVGLAVVTTISHTRMWFYDKKNFWALVWSVLYGIPTLVFLLLSLITLGSAVANAKFQMPTELVVIRALAGYIFAFTSLLYTQIGIPQERDRLAKKDQKIASLQAERDATVAQLQRERDIMVAQVRSEKETMLNQLRLEKDANYQSLAREKELMIRHVSQENERLKAENQRQKEEMETQKRLLVETKTANQKLVEDLHKSDDMALGAYSEKCIQWLKSGIKTASAEQVSLYTGHTKRKLVNAMLNGNLQVSPRNKDLILISSLVEWLKNNLPTTTPGQENEMSTEPLLHVVGSR